MMNDKCIKLGVAVVASPLEVGANQGPNLLQRLQITLSASDKLNLCTYQTPVANTWDAIKAGRQFYDERVHAVVIVAASWFEDYLVLDMLEECDAPTIIWGIPGMETGSLCGTQQLSFMLKQLSKPYKLLYDDLTSQSALKRLLEYASTAALRYYLRRAQIGYLGHRVEGMTETTAHELALKKIFGPRIIGIDSQVFLNEVSKVEEDSVQKQWEKLKIEVGNVKCSNEAGVESLKVHHVLKSFINEKMLNALAIGCYPHLMGKVCLAASLLGEEGIPLACEGDINGALGMLILTRLSGEPTYNTDLLNPILEDNAIVFSHCGSSSFSLANDLSEVTLAPVRLMDRGLCCLFTAKPGPVTLVNIVPTMNNYQIGVMFGNAVKTDMVFPGNPLKVQFDSDVKEVLNWIEDEGLGHHWMAAYGDLRNQLADFAGMVGCQLTTCPDFRSL
jgi:L-fucose isomerase-like protein